MYGKLYILLFVFILVYNDRVDGQMKKEVNLSTQTSMCIKFGGHFGAFGGIACVSPAELEPEVMHVKLVTRVDFK